MAKKEDANTRYYIDLDLNKKVILNWDYDDKHNLAQELDQPYQQRVFITKGQYNKLDRKAKS
jgi:hypothetical protein